MTTTVADVEVRGKSNVGSVVGKDIQGVQNTLNQFQRVARASFAGASLAGVIGFTGEMVQLGAQINRSTAALNALSAGQADAYIAKIKEETHGLVSEASAAGIATNLLGLKIVSTADEAAEFTRIAATLGGTFRGLGAEQAAQEMSLLFSNMSLLRLDTFGISAAKVRARIQELQEATPGLTREIAFQQAAMEEARISADKLSGSLTDQAASVERLRVKIQDAKADIAVFLADGLLPWLDGLQKVGRAIKEHETLMARQASIQRAQMAQEDYNQALENAPGYVRRAMQESRQYGQELQHQQVITSASVRQLNAGMIPAQEELGSAFRQTTYDLEKQSEIVKAQQAIYSHWVDIQKGSLGTVTSLTDGWHSWSEIGQQLVGDLGSLNIPAGELVSLQREIALKTGLATQDQINQAEALDAAKIAFEQGKLSAQGLLDVYLAIPSGVQAANEALKTGLEDQDKGLTYARESKDYYADAPQQALDPLQKFQQGLIDTQGSMTAVGDSAEVEFGRVDASMDVSMGKAQFLREEINNIGAALSGLSNVNIYGHIAVTGFGERQYGGPVTAGEAYVVGERGAELFVPSQSGRILSSPQTSAVVAGGSESNFFLSGPINLYPQGPTGIADALEELGVKVAGL